MNPAESAAGAGDLPFDVTILGMFLSAHLVVQLVMIGLILASVWTWAIIINKYLLFGRVERAMDKFEEVFWSGNSLEELYQTLSERQVSGMASLFVSAMREWKRSFSTAGSYMGMQARIEKVLDVSIAREVERLQAQLIVLASVASSAPFIGLFGTVWGIMTSFRSIAVSKNTSLAAVAPGIAEALFSTALGLLAAIPALIFYNALQGRVARSQARLESFSDEFSSILSRQIDHHVAAERGRVA